MSHLTDEELCAAAEARVGIRFARRHLLLTALTHRSYLNEAVDCSVPDNERLEFLGDAFIDYVAARYLFERLPDAQEGELTVVRAALVCQAATARYARRIGLGAFLRLGRGEEASGGRQRAALLGDALEALVGAILLDAGSDVAEQFLLRLMEPELAVVLAGKRTADSRSRFQEIAQQRWQQTPRYMTVAESGPDHAKRFVVQVYVGDRVWGSGEGSSKAVAARRAAEAGLRALEHGADSAECQGAPKSLDGPARRERT